MMGPVKRRLFLRISIILGAALVILAGATAIYLKMDEDPPDDADLILVRREVAPEDNGFRLVDFQSGDPDFVELPDGSKWDSCLPYREEWDPAFARKALEDNARALARIDAALALKDFQVPPGLTADTKVPYFRIWRILSNLTEARIEL